MYGAQTTDIDSARPLVFENDVEMYGAQTHYHMPPIPRSLRMM